MPPLTRSAARQLLAGPVLDEQDTRGRTPALSGRGSNANVAKDSVVELFSAQRPQSPQRLSCTTIQADAYSLRRPVKQLAVAVWKARDDTDAYTKMSAGQVLTQSPETDHCIEVQLVENALVCAAKQLPTDATALATCTHTLRNAFNSIDNLNVTTRSVNQAKKGPFTAAVNRLYGSSGRTLRVVSAEQLARTGAAKKLCDDGTWQRIEDEVARSFELLQDKLAASGPGGRQCNELCHATMEELQQALSRIEIL